MRRGARAAVALVTAALPVVGLANPAPALELARRVQASGPALELVEQTAVTEPDGELVMRVRVGDPPVGAKMEVRVYDRVRSRSEFARTIEGEGLRRELTSSRFEPLDNLGLDAASTVLVRVPIRSVSNGDTTRLRLTTVGVYPVAVVLADEGGSVLTQLVTHLVRLPATDDESPPLAVAVVVPIHAAPALQPSGTTNLPDAARGDITATIDALGDVPQPPLTVEPTPETVEALSQGLDPGDEGLLTSLRASLAGRQLLGGPYVDLDLNSWVASGLADELTAQMARGSDQLADQLGRPDGRTWVAHGPLTDASLDRLRGQGVDQLVLPELALEPIDENDFPVTLSQAFEIDSPTDGRIRAVAADTALAAHVNASDDPVLDVHHLLADLATIYFDAPPQPRGCVVALPDDAPPRAFLDAVLGGLRDGRILSGVTVDGLFAEVPVAASDSQVTDAEDAADALADPLVRAFVPTDVEGLGAFPLQLAVARQALNSYITMIGVDNPRSDPFEQRILVAGSRDLSSMERQAYTDAVVEGIAAEIARIEVPTPQTITLTARNGHVPLSITNGADYPMRVLVRLESDRLEFPDNPNGLVSLDLAPSTTTHVDVAVRARTSGDTSVEITVTSPDGSLQLARTRFTVRSTAVSGLGVVLSIGAGLFLLVWWARNFRTTRRSRRLVDTS